MGPRAWIGGMAAGGVVATHLLTFALLAPDAHARADLLARSGHGSFTLVAAAAIGLLTATTAHLCVRAASRTHAAASPGIAFAATAARLAGAQAFGWLALETAERVAHSGAHWEPRAFAVGLVVQALVAVAGALLLRALHRGAARIAKRLRARRRWAAAAPPPARPATSRRLPALRPALLAGASGLRGPPRS